MKLVINVPDYVKEQADDGKGEELGIPLWLAYEIANGTPHETITEFADRCRECGSSIVDKHVKNETNAMLDKIRAEIEKDIWEDVVVTLDGTDETRIPRLDPDEVLKIIDKYKAESEE